ncbi:MAG TPA: glycosyltransferase [Patescibacteria group bacterium]
MKIGIDISQVAYEKTGVANFVENLVKSLIEEDSENEYVLFYSSLRKELDNSFINGLTSSRVRIKQFRFPPTILDLLWNRLHILPIEWFIGPVDIFISSDWTQPPTKAKRVTILYDLIVYKYPQETHNRTQFNLKNFLLSPNIVASQKRRLFWVKKEVDKILCISKATKKDAEDILGIEENRLEVIYPGI